MKVKTQTQGKSKLRGSLVLRFSLFPIVVELPYWLKADFCQIFWEFSACNTQKIIEIELTLGQIEHQITWKTQKTNI